jgi:peptidoglycan/xylan/chitin deacetylase (PgdA/CDA1 family)
LALLPFWAYEQLFPRDLLAFFYHAVSDESLPHVKHLYPPVSVERFEQALLFLKQKFNPVGYSEVHDHVIKGTPLPKKAVHLSFDDGFGECFTVVRPLLLKHKIPCTFFVASDWIDNQVMFFRNKVSVCIESMRSLDKSGRKKSLRTLSTELDIVLKTSQDFEHWIKSLLHADEAIIDKVCEMLEIEFTAYLQEKSVFLTSNQVRIMAEEGFTIGSHSRSHSKMSQISLEDMEAEIVESAKVIQKVTGDQAVSFSFPFSATGIDREVLADIRQRNPFLGLFFDTRGLREDEPFMINRIWAEKAEFSDLGEKTNLPHLLKAAYRDLAITKLGTFT